LLLIPNHKEKIFPVIPSISKPEPLGEKELKKPNSSPPQILNSEKLPLA
jgi:hypothetical protein